MEWKLFHVGAIFEVKRPVARNKDDYEDGDIPFVASGANNNGVMKCCTPKGSEELDKGCCITVSPVDGSSFYQPVDFLGRGGAGSSVLMLYGSAINEMNGQFVARMVSQTCSKYTYGHMGNKNSLKREIMQLPSTNDGTPDWDYMSSVVSDIREKLLEHYKDYAIKQLSTLEYKEIPALNQMEWRPFYVPHIFTEIERGKRLKKADHVQGNMPYVSSTAMNNGVDAFITATPGTRVFGDCLSLANSGSVGSTFYEPFDYVASDHVTHLKHDGFNKWVYLFLVAVVEKQGVNFNFNREINDTRINKMQIMLPVADNGKPDYNYMEQYAKNLMFRKYNQYLAYARHEEN